jgi:hypothetical protein
MSGAHEPREEFVSQLEGRLRAELRRRQLNAGSRTWSWLPQSRLAAGLALATMVVVSMALGGGVVAATYEVQRGQQREVLLATFEQRLAIATQRLALANQQLKDIQQRVSVGIEQADSALDMEFKVREADADLKSITLDIAEIQATGREPMHALSAPLVSGRDFVTERWRVEMTVPAAALALEKRRAEAAQGRVRVGLGKPGDIDAANTRVAELESVVQAFDRKLAIRQTFLKGGLAAPIADLRGLEAENESRRTALSRRIEFARRRVQELQANAKVGIANPLEVAEAELRVQELQLEMTKADYELLLIRKQLAK